MREVIDARDRRLAGVTAPAHGLTMDWISYDALSRTEFKASRAPEN
jgi:hypothetical protein